MRTQPAEIRDRLYRQWMLSTAPMALVVVALLFADAGTMAPAMIAVWLQFVIYLIHEFEEHVLPGGFKDFVNERLALPALRKRFGEDRVPATDFPLDDRAVFWINITFIWIAFPLFAVLAARSNLAWGAVLPAVGIVNALLHIAMGLKLRAYNPGLVVSVTLNVPTGIWTMSILHTAGVSMTAIWAAIAGAVLMHAGLVLWAVRRALRTLRSTT